MVKANSSLTFTPCSFQKPFIKKSLAGAVSSLVTRGKKIVIITGFYIPIGDPPATETDGPPGALILAEGLKYLGMEVSLLSDEYTLPALKAGLKALNLSQNEIPLICFPLEHSDLDHRSRMLNEENESSESARFSHHFFESLWGQSLTHLVYIERVGPNHTLESLIAQERQGKPPLKDFETILPPPIRNRCFSSRLEDITRFTAKTHFLLDLAERLNLPAESIGIGDRGNEIGAGKIPWEVFKQYSSTNQLGRLCLAGRSGLGHGKIRHPRKSHSGARGNGSGLSGSSWSSH